MPNAHSPTLRYRRRKRWLGIHAALFAILNAANIGQWLLPRDASLDDIDPRALATFWPAWLILTWGALVGIRGLYVWAHKPVVEIEDPGPFGWRSGRAVRTVVLTDVVGSTERAREMGDSRWKQLLARHDRLAEQLARRFRGAVVKHIGGGQLAVFDSPREAIRVASTFRAELRGLDLVIRAGIHPGEVETCVATSPASAFTSPPGWWTKRSRRRSSCRGRYAISLRGPTSRSSTGVRTR